MNSGEPSESVAATRSIGRGLRELQPDHLVEFDAAPVLRARKRRIRSIDRGDGEKRIVIRHDGVKLHHLQVGEGEMAAGRGVLAQQHQHGAARLHVFVQGVVEALRAGARCRKE